MIEKVITKVVKKGCSNIISLIKSNMKKSHNTTSSFKFTTGPEIRARG